MFIVNIAPLITREYPHYKAKLTVFLGLSTEPLFRAFKVPPAWGVHYARLGSRLYAGPMRFGLASGQARPGMGRLGNGPGCAGDGSICAWTALIRRVR